MLEASGLQLPREGAQRHNGPELDPGAVARHRYHNTLGTLGHAHDVATHVAATTLPLTHHSLIAWI